MSILLGICVGIALMVFRDISWIILCRRRFLPEMVPKCVGFSWDSIRGIFINSVVEETLFRGPLLLVALWQGTTSIFTISLLVLGALIFGIAHISVVDDQFITDGWSGQERRRARAGAVFGAIWSGFVYGFLVLFYSSLLPSVVIHSARNAVIDISRIRYQKKREIKVYH